MDYEKKDFRKLYEDLVKSDWFKKAYHNKSLGECPFDIPELAKSEDERIRKKIIENVRLSGGYTDEEIDEMISWLEKQKEQKQEWKPKPESLEALMYAIEGKWDRISPTSYLSRRLEDLYEGLVNTFNVDESLLAELPKVASRAYTAEGIEELRELKRKIETSMEQKPAEWSEEDKGVLLSIKCVIDEVWHSTSDINIGYSREELKEMWEWLDEIWQRVEYPVHEEKWDKEDEDTLNNILYILNQLKDNIVNPEDKTAEKCIAWLKSLRPSWKPSEEQMTNLLRAEGRLRVEGESILASKLAELYEQLKKL